MRLENSVENKNAGFFILSYKILMTGPFFKSFRFEIFCMILSQNVQKIANLNKIKQKYFKEIVIVEYASLHRGRRPWQNRILILVVFRLRAQFYTYKNTSDILQVFPSG